MGASKLFGLPKAAASWEAPASYLSRVALSQGVSMRELMRLLKVEERGPVDLDLVTQGGAFRKAAGEAGIDLEQLHDSNRVLRNFRRHDLDASRYLLSAADGSARYRFCPLCLRDARTPCIEVHWRFDAWRYCPTHMCLMVDQCPKCRAHVVLPETMRRAGPDRRGVACLSHCLRCDTSLAQAPVHRDGEGLGVDPPNWDSARLANGRAVLAALYYDRVDVCGGILAGTASLLKKLDLMGILPNEMRLRDVNNRSRLPLGLEVRLEAMKRWQVTQRIWRESPADQSNATGAA